MLFNLLFRNKHFSCYMHNIHLNLQILSHAVSKLHYPIVPNNTVLLVVMNAQLSDLGTADPLYLLFQWIVIANPPALSTSNSVNSRTSQSLIKHTITGSIKRRVWTGLTYPAKAIVLQWVGLTYKRYPRSWLHCILMHLMKRLPEDCISNFEVGFTFICNTFHYTCF